MPEHCLPAANDERAAAIEWARAAIADPETLFLDTETTGFPPAGEVVDIAVVNSRGEILLDTLVRPRARIPAGASRVHGIYDDHVADAPLWMDVFPAFMAIIMLRTVVVYNAEFDSAIVQSCAHADRLAFPMTYWDCAMHAYAAFSGQPSGRTRGGYRWFKLEEAARSCGITPGGHRALADAEACRRVVLSMAETPI